MSFSSIQYPFLCSCHFHFTFAFSFSFLFISPVFLLCSICHFIFIIGQLVLLIPWDDVLTAATITFGKGNTSSTSIEPSFNRFFVSLDVPGRLTDREIFILRQSEDYDCLA
ncbi:hypothetical protein ASPWEDRAFT_466074 [Aspergillus wentii DTO 134E9]|uniref:Uncharacterized protein n=1 Tax=Aspergillus wentii DTO 134E9 TaxID=1073089 RepID=A0A1L9RS51_ASPWE|nr:uncharacterized protein ASPWEDRAFT_466074 [Aspergillus wentii DTO 134E9]OJJ37703.1 hypothetical protein ASPWEDRAFT_466074 [Aspergillus wentii DTO 134E9]